MNERTDFGLEADSNSLSELPVVPILSDVPSQSFPSHIPPLKYQNASTQASDKPYQCVSCEKCFAQLSYLNAHVARVHQGLKPHRCKFEGCNSSFFSPRERDVHMLVHSNELPFTCTWEGCGRKFRQAIHLTLHMRIHREERPYSCDQCGRQSRTAAAHNRHLQSHTGERKFVCDYPGCERRFTQLTVLKTHKLTHISSESRPYYVCSFEGCRKRFTREANLNLHMTAHTGMEKYVCSAPGCGARFCYKSSLKKHAASHAKAAQEKQKQLETVATFPVNMMPSPRYGTTNTIPPPAYWTIPELDQLPHMQPRQELPPAARVLEALSQQPDQQYPRSLIQHHPQVILLQPHLDLHLPVPLETRDEQAHLVPFDYPPIYPDLHSFCGPFHPIATHYRTPAPQPPPPSVHQYPFDMPPQL